jgi:hypothetical protein
MPVADPTCAVLAAARPTEKSVAKALRKAEKDFGGLANFRPYEANALTCWN